MALPSDAKELLDNYLIPDLTDIVESYMVKVNMNITLVDAVKANDYDTVEFLLINSVLSPIQIPGLHSINDTHLSNVIYNAIHNERLLTLICDFRNSSVKQFINCHSDINLFIAAEKYRLGKNLTEREKNRIFLLIKKF